MASLSSARSALVDLKIQLAKSNQEYFSLLAANPNADTTSVLANIASIKTSITDQRRAVRIASGFQNLANVDVSTSSSISTTFDTVPTSGSTKAMQSGGAFTSLTAKQDTIPPSSDITVGNVTSANFTTSLVTCDGPISGTLTTSRQTGITLLGTLTELDVEGPVSIVSPALTVDSANNRIGIDTSTPQYTLDMVGDLNMTQSLRHRGNATIDVSTNRLGDDITGSNLSSVGTLTSLEISGNVHIDSNTFHVNSTTNRVGICQSDPQYELDVVGNANIYSNVSIGNASLLINGDTLGAIVTTSNLSTVGILTGVDIAGNVLLSNGTASLTNVSMGNVTVTGNLKHGGHATFGTVYNQSRFDDTDIMKEGSYLSWNHLIGTGDMDLINKSGSGSGGIYFYNSAGNNTDWTNRSLLASITENDFVCNSYSEYQVPCFRVVKVSGKGSVGESFNPPSLFSFTSTAPAEIMDGNFSRIAFDVKPSGSSRGWNRTQGAYEAPIAGYYRFEFYIRIGDNSNDYAYIPRRLYGANYSSVENSVKGESHAIYITRNGIGQGHSVYYTIMYMNEGDRFAVRCHAGTTNQPIIEAQLSGCFLST